MFLRRIVAGALLTAIIATPCLGACAGWTLSAHDRMACCVDKALNEADACCASGEGRQNADVSPGLGLAALPAPTVVSNEIAPLLTAPQLFTPQWDGHDRIRSDSHRHVLLSVFLI